MATKKIVTIYKVKQDIQGIAPSGISDDNFEKLNIIGNTTDAQGIFYIDTNNLGVNNVQNAIDKIIVEGSNKIKYDNNNSKLQATNVQSAIDELQTNRNIIPDEQEHYAGYYWNGKPVYYRSYGNRVFSTNSQSLGISNLDKVVEVYHTSLSESNTNYLGQIVFGDNGRQACTTFGTDISIYLSSNYKIKDLIVYYTKTTDSRIL